MEPTAADLRGQAAREYAVALTRIVAVTHPDNHASQRVALRLGMADAGTTDRYYDTTTRLFVLER